jgi:hypothetical protein
MVLDIITKQLDNLGKILKVSMEVEAIFPFLHLSLHILATEGDPFFKKQQGTSLMLIYSSLTEDWALDRTPRYKLLREFF